MRDAAERVCVKAEGPFDTRLTGLSMELTCAERTYRDARSQISVAIQRAKSGQPQLATAFIIALPARTR